MPRELNSYCIVDVWDDEGGELQTVSAQTGPPLELYVSGEYTLENLLIELTHRG
jgi:hypothetical protein